MPPSPGTLRLVGKLGAVAGIILPTQFRSTPTYPKDLQLTRASSA